jgi:hypothetical protein
MWDSKMIIGYFGPISAANIPDLWGPMIRFSLSKSTRPAETEIVERDLVALIDTGSDLCRVDTALATKYNLIERGTMPAVGSGVQSIVQTYSLQVILEDQTKLQLTCPSVRLREVGAPFDFLFGMDAIRFFDLSIARSRQAVSLSNFHP